MYHRNKQIAEYNSLLQSIKNNQYPFPYKRKVNLAYNDIGIRNNFNALKKFDIDGHFVELQTPYSLRNVNYSDPKFRGKRLIIQTYTEDYEKFDVLSDMFMEEQRLHCHVKNNDSPWNVFHNSPEVILSSAYLRGKELTPYNIREAIYHATKECTSHRPSHILMILAALFPEKRGDYKGMYMYDSSSGWGDRLIGAMAAGINYVGTDPNLKLISGYQAIGEMFSPLTKSSTQHIIYKLGSETNELRNILQRSKYEFDLYYTSPPYFDYETYSQDNTQSTALYSSEESWFKNFLIPTLQTGWASIKNGGYMAININQENSKQTIIQNMLDTVNNTFVGAQFEGVISYINQGYDNTKKINPQPIWIWKKVMTIPEVKENTSSTSLVSRVVLSLSFIELIKSFFETDDDNVKICLDKVKNHKDLLYEILVKEQYVEYLLLDIPIRELFDILELQTIFAKFSSEKQSRLNDIIQEISDEDPEKGMILYSIINRDKNRRLLLDFYENREDDRIHSLSDVKLKDTFEALDIEMPEIVIGYSMNIDLTNLTFNNYFDRFEELMINITSDIMLESGNVHYDSREGVPRFDQFITDLNRDIQYYYIFSIIYGENDCYFRKDAISKLGKSDYVHAFIRNNIAGTSISDIASTSSITGVVVYKPSSYKRLDENTTSGLIEMIRNILPKTINKKMVYWKRNDPDLKKYPSLNYLYWENMYILIGKIMISYPIQPITKYEDIAFTLPYYSSKDFAKYNLHAGQRKLFLSELQFLNDHLKSHTDKAYVIYAGAAPSNKAFLLATMFPNVHFIFVDPNEFSIYIEPKKSHYEYPPDDEIHENIRYIYSAHPGKNKTKPTLFEGEAQRGAYLKEKKSEVTNVILNSNISIIEDYYTRETSVFLREVLKKENVPIFFWSDIRTGDEESPKDLDVIWNNAMQVLWIYDLQPHKVMLKFRAPFRNDVDDFNIRCTLSQFSNTFQQVLKLPPPYNIDFIKDFNEGNFNYFEGDIMIQSRAPVGSTESRLIFSLKGIQIRNYDANTYEDKFNYYNNVCRMFQPISNPYSDIGLGFDECNDCALEGKIWEKYHIKSGTPGHELKQKILEEVQQFNDLTGKSLLFGGHGKLFAENIFGIGIRKGKVFSENEKRNLIVDYYKQYLYGPNKRYHGSSTAIGIASTSRTKIEDKSSEDNSNQKFAIYVGDGIDSANSLIDVIKNYKNVVLVKRWEEANLILKARFKGLEELARPIYPGPESNNQFSILVTKLQKHIPLFKNLIVTVFNNKDPKFVDGIMNIINTSLYNDTNIYNEIWKYYAPYRNKNTDENRATYREQVIKDIFVNYLSTTNTIGTVDNYLDIGCNEGKITSTIGKLFNAKNIQGCDVEEPTTAPDFNFSLINENDKHYPYENNSQDIISTFQVLHHIKYMSNAILDIHRMLKDNGLFIIREHDCNSNELALILDLVHGMYAMCTEEKQEMESFTQHYAKYLSQYDMNCFIESAGFKRLYSTQPTGKQNVYYAVYCKHDCTNYDDMFNNLTVKYHKQLINISKPLIPIINSFPDHELVTNKDNLINSLKVWCDHYQLDVNKIAPRTVLARDFGSTESTSIFNDVNHFIIKPTELFGGKDIMLATRDNIQEKLKSIDLNNYIVQEYISDIKTYNKKKFDIRVNIVVGPEGDIWQYNKYLLRISANDYNLDEFDSSTILTHVTNLDLENSKTSTKILQDILNYKTQFPDLEHSIDQFMMQYINPFILETVVKKYYDWDNAKKYYSAKCYQRFGIDLIVKSDNTIRLLEINTNPGVKAGSDNVFFNVNMWRAGYPIPDNFEKYFTVFRYMRSSNINSTNTIINSKLYINPRYFDAPYYTLLAYKYGVKIVGSWEEADAIWKYKFPDKDLELLKGKTINRLLGIDEICDKDKLALISDLPTPETFAGSNITSLTKDLYIIKPVKGHGGVGIKLVKKEDVGSTLKEYKVPVVVQEYISDLMLLNGYKFDLRVNYVIYYENNKLIVKLYNNIFARMSEKLFTLDDLDHDIHVTNLHLRDRSDSNVKMLAEFDDGLLRNKIIEFSSKNLKPLFEKYLSRPKDINAYQFVGIDILVKKNGDIVLLEMNSAPSTSEHTAKMNFNLSFKNRSFEDLSQYFTEIN